MTGVTERLLIAAEFVASLPDGVPAPTIQVAPWAEDIDVRWHLHTDEQDQLVAANAIRRGIGGEWSKSAAANDFWLKNKVERDGVMLDMIVFCDREQVCTRRVVGTETVTLPAQRALPMRTEERDIVEWDCEPILAKVGA